MRDEYDFSNGERNRYAWRAFDLAWWRLVQLELNVRDRMMPPPMLAMRDVAELLSALEYTRDDGESTSL